MYCLDRQIVVFLLSMVISEYFFRQQCGIFCYWTMTGKIGLNRQTHQKAFIR